MHLKLAECYNSKSTNSSDVDNCCQKNIFPAENANRILDHEINQLQNRLERCAQACGDEVHDKHGSASSSQADAMMQKCLSSCGDKHLALMKSVQLSIEKQLDDIIKKY